MAMMMADDGRPAAHGVGSAQGTNGQALLLVLCSCLPVLGSVLVAPILPLIGRAYAGEPHVEILTPMIIGLPALFIALLSPVMGSIADRWGKRRLIVFALIVYAIIGGAPLLLSSLPAIVTSRLLLGAPEGAIMTVCTALIGDYLSGDRRTRIFSIQTMATSLAAVIFVVVGGALGSIGWRTPFLIYLVAGLIAPIAWLVVTEPVATVEGRSAPIPALPLGRLLPLYVLSSIGAIGFYVVPTEVAYVLQTIGSADPMIAGLVTGAGQVAVLAGAIGFSRLARLGLHTSIGLGFVLTGIGLAVLGLGSVSAIWTGSVVAGLGSGILLPSFVTAVMRQLSAGQRGRGAGGFTTAFFLGQFLCPLTVVALSGAFGSLAPAVATIGIVMIAASIAGVFIARRAERASPIA